MRTYKLQPQRQSRDAAAAGPLCGQLEHCGSAKSAWRAVTPPGHEVDDEQICLVSHEQSIQLGPLHLCSGLLYAQANDT